MKRIPPSRRGFSLVELLTTITVLTILLGLCAGLIRVLLRLDQSGRDAMTIASDQVRLSRTFRDDAHRSTSPTPLTIRPDHLTLNLPDDSQADYTLRPSDVLRELHQGGKVRRREVYRLPRRGSVRFESSTEAGRPMISLHLHREPGQTPGPFEPDERTDAELGRVDRLIARKP